MAPPISGREFFLHAIIAGMVLFSCKAPENSTQSLIVQHAYWYNWSGGIPGIGGTNYEIQVGSSIAGEISFDSLIVDGEKLTVEQRHTDRNVYMLFISADKSSRSDVVGHERTGRPDFRKENPESAYLTGSINGKAFELEIPTFERKANQNMR